MLGRRLITVTGSLTGSRIGLTLDVRPNIFTSGFPNYHTAADLNTIFFCDRPLLDSLDLTPTSVPAGEAIMRSRVQDHWVPYLEYGWDSINHVVTSTTKILFTEIGWNETPTDETQYKRLNSSDEKNILLGTKNSTLHEFYVVMDEEVKILSAVINGPNVHIILCDNVWLHQEEEMNVYDSTTVYFHAQSCGSSIGRMSNDEASTLTYTRGGIGGGEDGNGANVTINGGVVIAKAGLNETGCRAIGPGRGSDNYGKLTLGDDLMVSSERKATAAERKNMCWYRTQVTITPCDHSEVTYTVDGYTAHDHHIAHCAYCNHKDTVLHTFDEHGVCTVCGVKATAYAVKLYMPQAQADGSFDGQTYSKTVSHLVVPDSAFRLPMATLNVPGYQFIGWEATTEPTEDTYTSPYTTATADTLYRTGNKYTVTGNICFVARYKVADIYLFDDEPNGETLNEYNNMTVAKVILSGRVFNKNNTWQPLTLPFGLSADELAASPLAECTLKQLNTDSSYLDTENKLVYLYFKDTTAIEAGKPYIIRWAEGNPILSPEFENVTLTNKTVDARARLLMYKSLYSPQTFTSANKMALYFREDGVLVHPNGQEPVTVGAFRAYFRLTNLMGGDSDAELTITTNLNDAQGIEEVQRDDVQCTKVLRNGMLFIERNGRIYDAQGQMIK